MQLVVLVPGQTSVLVEADSSLASLASAISHCTHIPVSHFRLFHESRVLTDPLPPLPNLSTVHLSLALPGGIYDPTDYRLAMEEQRKLICRRCYCRNPYDRKTCRKCGHPDLRGGKQSYRGVPRDNNPARKQGRHH